MSDQAPDNSKANAEDHKSRAVDLGREDQLVTWAEWFARTSGAMQKVVGAEGKKALRFRVVLKDGRVFAVRQAMSHVSRGKCTIEPSRWHDEGSACDVITGYQMLGEDAVGNLTMLAITPDQIASVECVLPRPRKEQEEPEPFGFASFLKLKEEMPELTEVDEPMGGQQPRIPAPADQVGRATSTESTER